VCATVTIDRRQFLTGVGASLGAASISCGDNRSTAPDAAPQIASGAACPEPDPRSAGELLAGIDTLVVLCMENRSFDECLGSLRVVEGRRDLDGLTGDETNPDRDGNPVAVHRLDDVQLADPPHNWDACHRQWNQGANDGFVVAHAGAYQADVMGYRVRSQLPVTYALADAGTICQRWFASCLGPTWPNRYYLHAATAGGQQQNFPMPGLGPTIWDRLGDAGLRGVNYYHDIPWAFGGFGKTSGLAPIEQFFADAATGALPPLALIDPGFFGAGASDDHATHDSRLGQALIASVVAALGASPQWDRCLFVLTYDEHGGFFDHVAPPALRPDVELDPAFRTLGFRVPTVVVGPHVRRGCAIDTVFEHSSLLATVSRRFGLAPLNPRAAAAADLSPCLDPSRLGAPLPAPALPVVEISERQLARAAEPTHASHAELADALVARPAPRHLDRRGEADQITRRVLGWGERLGAVRVTR
jgi:phospholipase C